jgi:DNA-binding NarL/FixJ family response regulator
MKRAVVVEDYKIIADIWKVVLFEVGFEDVLIINQTDNSEDSVVEYNPDIILMDLNVPGKLNGLDLAEVLLVKNKLLKVLMLTTHSEKCYVDRAFEIGARGYVTKNSPIIELKTAISEILSGNRYVCKELLSA